MKAVGVARSVLIKGVHPNLRLLAEDYLRLVTALELITTVPKKKAVEAIEIAKKALL